MRFPVTVSPSSSAYGLYLEAYRGWLAQESMAENTRRVYHSRIKQFLLFLEYTKLSEFPLQDLNSTNKAIDLYLAFLKKDKSNAKSINANINALNNFSHFLGLNLKKPKRERVYYRPLKTLTKKEQNDFLLSVRRQKLARDRALVFVLFYTGLRLGDCARLTIENILWRTKDRENEDICQGNIADNAMQNCAKQVAAVQVGDAQIAVNEQTAMALIQWLKERQKIPAEKSDAALWITEKGKSLSVSGMTFVIKRIGWQAKLVLSAETLRRTFLANAGGKLSKEQLAANLGDYISEKTIKKLDR